MDVANLAVTRFLLMLTILSNIALTIASTQSAVNESTLLLVTTVFRHGDRTPDTSEIYPNSPLVNASFSPYSNGDLTQTGQKHMYEFGQELQKSYTQFLGNFYDNDMLKATSSSVRRCQMSMEALLAGLFAGLFANNMTSNQQAVPYYTIPPNEDIYLSVHLSRSGIRNKEVPDDYISPETRQLFNYIEHYSGFQNVSYLHTILLCGYVRAIEGLEAENKHPNNVSKYNLSEWLTAILPDPLMPTAVQGWKYLLTKEKLRVIVGPLLENITREAKMKESLQPHLKMSIWMGHDMNIHGLLLALDVWPEEEIKYGASIRFELHRNRSNDEFGFKIYLQNGYPQPKLLVIPQCDELCTLCDFAKRTQHISGVDPDEIC